MDNERQKITLNDLIELKRKMEEQELVMYEQHVELYQLPNPIIDADWFVFLEPILEKFLMRDIIPDDYHSLKYCVYRKGLEASLYISYGRFYIGKFTRDFDFKHPNIITLTFQYLQITDEIYSMTPQIKHSIEIKDTQKYIDQILTMILR